MRPGSVYRYKPHRCRHRRPRPLIATTLAAALLTLTLGVGVRIGNTAASVAHATATTCEAP